MANDVKNQIKLLETYVELIWAQNATRARYGRKSMYCDSACPVRDYYLYLIVGFVSTNMFL